MTGPAVQPPKTHAPLVLSGVQPTGNLHIGNYLGAIRNWVPMQDQMPCYFCVVDMHAITAELRQSDLRAQTREIAAAFIASGIDPKKSVIFPQNQVPAHAELAWIFNCVARMGWLNRMTQWKNKAGKHAEKMSVGLFAYPVLMAADILVYKATHVPVGEDQKQHLELARDIAQKFNNDMDAPDFFPLPEPLILGPAPRVMSLRDGKAKMSKSDTSDLSRINLTDSNDVIADKIRRAKTDPDAIGGTLEDVARRPELDNLLGIFAALSGETKAAVLQRFDGAQFSAFKAALAELIVAVIGPIRQRMQELTADPAHLDAILAEGSAAARARAAPVLAEVKRLAGFL